MKRIVGISLSIFLSIFLIAGCGSEPPKIKIPPGERLKQADALEDKTQALREYKAIVEDFPESEETVQAHMKSGRIYYDSNNYYDAIDEYSKAMDLQPDNIDAYFMRGTCYAESDLIEPAKQDLTVVIDEKPDFPIPYYILGDAYLRAGKYDTAVEYFTKAIEKHDAEAKYYYRRATAYHDKGKRTKDENDYLKAIQDYNRIIEVDPGYRPDLVYRWRADSYNMIGKYPEAIDDYTKAIELEPEDAVLYCDRGNCYLRSDKLEEARNDYVMAINIDPESAGGKTAYDNLQVMANMLQQKSKELTQDEVDKINSLEKEWAMNIDKAVPLIQERNYVAANVYVEKAWKSLSRMNDVLMPKGYDPEKIDRIAGMKGLTTVYSHLNDLSAYANNPNEAIANLAEVNALFQDTQRQLDEAEAKFHEVPPLQGLCRQIRGILNQLEMEVKKVINTRRY